MALTEEQAAHTEVTFRAANERIAVAVRELQIEWRAPYLCECEDERCATLVRLAEDEYQEVRSGPARFVLAPGHPFRSGHVVAERSDYIVVEKTGISGKIAQEAAGGGS